MARHIFKPWRGEGLVRSVSLCQFCFSSREAEAATAGQHTRAGDCQECNRLLGTTLTTDQPAKEEARG